MSYYFCKCGKLSHHFDASKIGSGKLICGKGRMKRRSNAITAKPGVNRAGREETPLLLL